MKGMSTCTSTDTLIGRGIGAQVATRTAANAGLHGSTIVTWNTADFGATGVATHNPCS
jgi:hypothetical protein